MTILPKHLTEALSRISPRDVMGYAVTRGWKQLRKSGRVMIYEDSKPDSLNQLLVPLDNSKPDFAMLMGDTIERLMEVEGRPAVQVVTDLINYDSDVLRFRIASQSTSRGTLPLIQAIDLLAGAKQTLLAAAHSVLSPKKSHPKLSRTEAVQLLDACQMGQTEHGSYVVTISCPMKAVDAEQAGLFDNVNPFARQTTKYLTESLSQLDLAIEENRVAAFLDTAKPVVSSNLCEALLKMRPTQEQSVLEFTPSWAPSVPTDFTIEKQTRSISFSNDDFVVIEDIYRQLRPVVSDTSQPFVAFVEELKGTENDYGVREGEVVFTIFKEDELIRAKASLNKDQYQTAYKAHNPTQPLLVTGILNRGPRVSRLTQITELHPLNR